MAVKFIVLAAVVAIGHAAPFYISAYPGAIYPRAVRGPSIAYGFGSGFATDIGGIKQSNSFGTSFQTGDGQAYGGGIASNDGNVFASGIGSAHTNPSTYRNSFYPYNPHPTPYYSSPYQYSNPGYNLRDSYGNAISSVQNFGNAGTSVTQSQNTPFGSAASAANFSPYQTRNSFRNPGLGSAVSFASTSGFGATAASTANGFGAAKSIAQNQNGGDYNVAISASETGPDGVGASTAQTVQQRGDGVQHSGATTINGPGIQASHSHAINTGNGVGRYY